MSYLYLIGLGLSKKFFTNKALEALKQSDIIFLDYYTSFSCDLTKEFLEKITGKEITLASRNMLENNSNEIMNLLDSGKNVAIASIGDPIIATTHVSIAVEANRKGHIVQVIPGISVHCYIISKSMLSSYKFGKSVTLVYPYDNIMDFTPYEVIKSNRALNLHTIVYLDIKDGKFMNAIEGLKYLIEMENVKKENVISMDDIAIIGQRLGCDDEKISAVKLSDLENAKLRDPPHIIIIPSKNLHYMEVEAIQCLH
ncbi:diphthine synthase [Acidianus brierleyi]|uniref:Diphthine synthase n=1 Tax=Acidianus brierleyi TaxID=41673 RepID=A0A2U9IGF9_9CREN|nr:diphthine synthase [Acidianus brierleyi]AWR95014.1 diphthine synthase [Acidianus brierleyi]